MHRVDVKTVVKPCAFFAWGCRRRRTKNNLKLGEKFHAFLMILENEFICAPNSSVISGKHWRFEWKFPPTFSFGLTKPLCLQLVLVIRHALIRKHLFFIDNCVDKLVSQTMAYNRINWWVYFSTLLFFFQFYGWPRGSACALQARFQLRVCCARTDNRLVINMIAFSMGALTVARVNSQINCFTVKLRGNYNFFIVRH